MRRALEVVIACMLVCAFAAPAVARTLGELSESHASIADRASCVRCHDPGSPKVSSTKCLGCHAHDVLAAQIQQGRGLHASPAVKGKPCESCHAEHRGAAFDLMGWQSLPGGESGFDHGLAAWDLSPRHRPFCAGCHTAHDQQGLRTYLDLVGSVAQRGCLGCHATSHNGRFTNAECLMCHGRSEPPHDPKVEIFHGEKSRFALRDGHRAVPCATCHTSVTATGYAPLDPSCGSNGHCHEDTLHRGSLGTQCIACHVPGAWPPTRFDHDAPFPPDAAGRSEPFPLGTHAKVACATCHPSRDFARPSATCVTAACHRGDDAHRGRLGTACGDCHLANGDVIFNHNAKRSTWKLDGKHLAVPCGDCHFSTTFRPRPTTCAGCHPIPANHRGRLDGDCALCHTTRTFVIRSRG